MISNEDSDAQSRPDESRPETARETERGDVAEPDAPTAEEENEGMSTILSADPVAGVQEDASNE